MLEWMESDSSLVTVVGVEQVREVEWLGDDRMFDFLFAWDQVLSYIPPDKIDDEQKREIIAKQVKKSVKLAVEYSYYPRELARGHPDGSYKYLREAISINIKIEREEKIAE